ncbi:MAG: biotin--[acetyl-CoA-carboxylase] ligase [Thermoguttaceae bacterium]
MRIPTIEYFDTISSTNDHLVKLLKQPKPPELPILAVARSQTAGRGRIGKKWWTADGSLACSLGLDLSKYSLSRNDNSTLSIGVGLTLLEMIRMRIDIFADESGKKVERNNVRIHWPNDIYFGDSKLAGILIESPSSNHVVIGVGINVNNHIGEVPAEFVDDFAKRPITSLIDIFSGRQTSLVGLIVEWTMRMEVILHRIATAPETVLQVANCQC